MKPIETIEIVREWCRLLEALGGIPVNSLLSPEDVSKHLTERQQFIDKLVSLDKNLTAVRKLKAEGWPDFDASSIEVIEEVIRTGNETLANIRRQDSELLENTAKLRSGVSGQLTNVRFVKRYLPANLLKKRHPSVIVDSHL